MPHTTVQGRQRRIYRVTILGSAVNIALTAFKLAAGILGRSSAMVADAIHSLSDLITDVIVVCCVHVSGKPKDRKHAYGYGKFETLATLIIGVVLLLVGVGIAWNGGARILTVLQGGTLESPGMVALVAAGVSLFSKEGLFRYTVREGRRIQSDVLVANAWHHRSDAFSSIATAAGIGGAIVLGPRWAILDPIAAVVVSVFIIHTAMDLVRPSLAELLERSLPEEIERHILETVFAFEGISDPHNLRTRKIGNGYAIELHVKMNPDTPLSDAHGRISRIESTLREHYGKQTHVIIRMEPA